MSKNEDVEMMCTHIWNEAIQEVEVTYVTDKMREAQLK